MKLTTPAHTHDCHVCRYIGSSLGSDAVLYDWYLHDHVEGQVASVIARHGSEGGDYSSWPADHVRRTDSRTNWKGMVVINEMMVVAQFMLRRHS